MLISQHREKKARGEKCYNFAFGQSPFPVPDVAINSLSKYAHENLYENVAGIQPLREKIIQVHPQYELYTPDGVIVTPGCKISKKKIISAFYTNFFDFSIFL